MKQERQNILDRIPPVLHLRFNNVGHKDEHYPETHTSIVHSHTDTDRNKLSRRKSRGNSVTLTLDLCLLEAVLLRSDRCLPRVSVSRRICSCSGLPFCGWVVVLSSLSLFSPLYPLFISFKAKKRPSLPLLCH